MNDIRRDRGRCQSRLFKEVDVGGVEKDLTKIMDDGDDDVCRLPGIARIHLPCSHMYHRFCNIALAFLLQRERIICTPCVADLLRCWLDDFALSVCITLG